MIELKKCPFCADGGHPVFHQIGCGNYEDRVANIYFEILCEDCGTVLPSTAGHVSFCLDSEGELDIRWDDRPWSAEKWNGRSE